MDINDNIVIKDEEIFDGVCDLCLKDFSSYDMDKLNRISRFSH